MGWRRCKVRRSGLAVDHDRLAEWIRLLDHLDGAAGLTMCPETAFAAVSSLNVRDVKGAEGRGRNSQETDGTAHPELGNRRALRSVRQRKLYVSCDGGFRRQRRVRGQAVVCR